MEFRWGHVNYNLCMKSCLEIDKRYPQLTMTIFAGPCQDIGSHIVGVRMDVPPLWGTFSHLLVYQ